MRSFAVTMHWNPKWQSALTQRAEGLTEILDGNSEAFERARPPFSRTTIREAQKRIVDGIALAERRSGGQKAVADLVIDVAIARMAVHGGSGRPARILDAAAGSGWLIPALWDRAGERRVPVGLAAHDLDPASVRSFRGRFSAEGIRCATRVVDARHMAGVVSGAWDVAVLVHTLHHFASRDAVWCLQELDRVTAGGALVIDVDRSVLGLVSIPAIVSLLAPRSFPYCARDGIASVRRAYRLDELERLLEDAGLRWRYRVGPLPT
ncbi:MAG TPA: class I SAM-dependent methyltransferase, partial [Candidatus Eisenbacteria bacterium]